MREIPNAAGVPSREYILEKRRKKNSEEKKMSLVSKITELTAIPLSANTIAATLGMDCDYILEILQRYSDNFHQNESGKWISIKGASIPDGPEYFEEHFFDDYECIKGLPPLLSDAENSSNEEFIVPNTWTIITPKKEERKYSIYDGTSSSDDS